MSLQRVLAVFSHIEMVRSMTMIMFYLTIMYKLKLQSSIV